MHPIASSCSFMYLFNSRSIKIWIELCVLAHSDDVNRTIELTNQFNRLRKWCYAIENHVHFMEFVCVCATEIISASFNMKCVAAISVMNLICTVWKYRYMIGVWVNICFPNNRTFYMVWMQKYSKQESYGIIYLDTLKFECHNTPLTLSHALSLSLSIDVNWVKTTQLCQFGCILNIEPDIWYFYQWISGV